MWGVLWKKYQAWLALQIFSRITLIYRYTLYLWLSFDLKLKEFLITRHILLHLLKCNVISGHQKHLVRQQPGKGKASINWLQWRGVEQHGKTLGIYYHSTWQIDSSSEVRTTNERFATIICMPLYDKNFKKICCVL